MEVGRLTPDWFRILVGDTIDYTEVRGWRKTGRPKQVNDPSFTELKTVTCIIDGPELEDVYMIAEMSKSSIVDKKAAFTSSFLEGGMKSDTRSQLIDEEMEEIFDKPYVSDNEDFISTLYDPIIEESDPYSHEPKESYKQESKGISKDFLGKEDKPREEDKPGYESGKEDEAPLKNKRSACSVM